jgi:peptidoglycan hydrolase-like protein with peptidoglycan-binding domain
MKMRREMNSRHEFEDEARRSKRRGAGRKPALKKGLIPGIKFSTVFPVRPFPVGGGLAVLPVPPAPTPPQGPQTPGKDSAPSGSPAPPPESDRAREGNEYVRWVQASLNKVLHLNLPADGVMGAETREAIRSFQRREKLPITGVVGPDTQQALVAATRVLRENEFGFELEWRELEEEVNRGGVDYIRWVQQSLNNLMGLRLAVDGVNGPMTRSAVRSFQGTRGLTMDGVVGPQTEAALIAAGAGTPPGFAGGVSPVPTPQTGVGTTKFLVGGVAVSPPPGLKVTNFLNPSVHRFIHKNNRRGRPVTEFVLHETVTTSVASTVQVLINRGLSVHLIMGPDGSLTQHGDLADDTHWHATTHNTPSVGVEVVNPYYPKYLRAGMPWTRVIDAGWAHERRYVVPTPQQAEAAAQLTAWITSPASRLSVPRTWIGVSGGRMRMSVVPGADRPRPGVYAHTYFAHADGSWLALYAWLRIERGRAPAQAYEEAIRLATTSNSYVTLP